MGTTELVLLISFAFLFYHGWKTGSPAKRLGGIGLVYLGFMWLVWYFSLAALERGYPIREVALTASILRLAGSVIGAIAFIHFLLTYRKEPR